MILKFCCEQKKTITKQERKRWWCHWGTGYNSQPCAIAVGDYNNDNETDIIVTECDSNRIEIMSKFC